MYKINTVNTLRTMEKIKTKCSWHQFHYILKFVQWTYFTLSSMSCFFICIFLCAWTMHSFAFFAGCLFGRSCWSVHAWAAIECRSWGRVIASICSKMMNTYNIIFPWFLPYIVVFTSTISSLRFCFTVSF